ncbi:uncharacterized protein LOC129318931 [Prosopis cineraria]|uniref:uncharacterized protein LOC129318931 n=1 Tax=Prosopis cineraria TaxID=364024 RepID=UPI00240EFBE7|nr:uncharacterized protein LOC129318931 [Prosopis cineraria]
MDQVRSASLESLNYQSFKAQYLIKFTQFLVSVSVFSFLFSPSSLLALFHYVNFYCSTFPLQLFTHTVDKNCMFLLCNGLLVFVGIARSFSGSSGSDDPHVKDATSSSSSSSSEYVDDGSRSEFSDIEATEPLLLEVEEPDEQNIPPDEAVEIRYHEGDEDIEKAIAEDEVDQEKEEEEEEEELRISHSVLEDDEESGMLDAGDKEGSKGHDLLIPENVEEEEIDYEEGEGEEESSLLSTEELNKKFDDFIRRMREDLRIEARQQLIMV